MVLDVRFSPRKLSTEARRNTQTMSLFEFVADLVWALFHLHRPDNDRSIVGEAPIDRGVALFWKCAGVAVVALFLMLAIRAWMA